MRGWSTRCLNARPNGCLGRSCSHSMGTAFKCMPTSVGTPTWPRAWRAFWASRCPRTFASPTVPLRPLTFGGVGTSPCRNGGKTMSTSPLGGNRRFSALSVLWVASMLVSGMVLWGELGGVLLLAGGTLLAVAGILMAPRVHAKLATAVNVMIVMLLGGLWHGAHVNFVTWGALNGAVLVLWIVWPFAFRPRGPNCWAGSSPSTRWCWRAFGFGPVPSLHGTSPPKHPTRKTRGRPRRCSGTSWEGRAQSHGPGVVPHLRSGHRTSRPGLRIAPHA